MSYGIGDYSGSSRGAEYTYRDLYNAQWQDYQDRFLPVQEQLINEATGTAMLDEQLGRITALSATSKSLSNEAATIARSRFGMEQSSQQQAAFNSNLNLDTALNMASAQNNSRSAAYDRYQSAMTGGTMQAPVNTTGETGGATS